MDRREFLKKIVGVGALYATGAAGLLLPKDVVAATSIFGHETVPSIANGPILAKNMKSVFFSSKMDMILMPTAMPVG